jgi:tRNA-dihydrouridine synthase
MIVPFMLAPMAELSHRPLRELIEAFGGYTEYFTEMISAPGLIGGGPFERWYIDGGPRPEKLVYQLSGADPEQLAAAAAILDKLDCRGIDLNMGCSAPAITRTGAGVRWMASVDRAAAMVGRVRKAVKHRLSVKLRIGLTDDFEYLVKFCRMLEREGVELLTLHPRTAKEKFKRRPRWEYVARLRAALGIPVAGNGDLTTAEELAGRAASREWDGVMAGRAAVRQPWIFAQALETRPTGGKNAGGVLGPPHTAVTVQSRTLLNRVNLEETGLRFLELLARYQPPEFHLSRAWRFFNYFCDNLTWATHVKNLLAREQNLTGIERAWRAYFRTRDATD